jgi:hypothetical protein
VNAADRRADHHGAAGAQKTNGGVADAAQEGHRPKLPAGHDPSRVGEKERADQYLQIQRRQSALDGDDWTDELKQTEQQDLEQAVTMR